jgi:antigen flippase
MDSPYAGTHKNGEALSASGRRHSLHSKPGARAFVATFATSALIQAATVLQGIIVARLLGPTGRGEYATVILWPSVFAAIGIFGTNIALARAAAKTDQYHAIIRTALFLALITSALSGALCYLCLPFLLPEAESHLLGLSKLFVVFILLNHLGVNLIAVDQGAGKFRRFNFTRAVLYPVYVSFLMGMWLLGNHQVKWAALGLLVANLAVVIVRLLFAWRDMRLWGHLYSPVGAIRESFQYGLVGAAMPLYQQADKAILLWLLGATNLGFYVVALSASAAIGSITSATGVVSFTVAAQSQQGYGFDGVAKTFRISALLWVMCGIPLAMAMPVLLPLVYGGDFAAAVGPAVLLIVGSAFAGLANLLDQTLRGQGRALVGFEGRIVGLGVMLAAGIVLATRSGLPGMCLAYNLGQLTCLSFFTWRILCHYSQPATAIKSLIVGWNDIEYLFARLHRMVASTVLR